MMGGTVLRSRPESCYIPRAFFTLRLARFIIDVFFAPPFFRLAAVLVRFLVFFAVFRLFAMALHSLVRVKRFAALICYTDSGDPRSQKPGFRTDHGSPNLVPQSLIVA